MLHRAKRYFPQGRHQTMKDAANTCPKLEKKKAPSSAFFPLRAAQCNFPDEA